MMIRPAMEGDAAELARLTSHLGYPASVGAIRMRLVRQLSRADDRVLVADAGGGALAGWIHGFRCQLLEADFRVEIGGLIVDEAHRRRGVGARLVQALEAWAREGGAVEMSVRCRVERKESHQFYEMLAYRPTKTQKVFRKRLDRTAEAG